MNELLNARRLEPLPYQRAVVDYLKTNENEVWEWFATNKTGAKQADTVRLDLLKATYRIERETQPRVYEIAANAAERLEIDAPVTIYQAQNAIGLNASLAYIPSEAHLVLAGPIIERLTDDELRALVGHELAHLLLWDGWGGDFLVADQILAAMTNDAAAEEAHFNTARRFGLYGEIFCDRGALLVADDPRIVVSMLVKVETDLQEVSAESYIRQAEEIFAREAAKTDGITHPEGYIRARAIQRWADEKPDADKQVAQMIEGDLVLGELDLLGQQRVADLTRRLIDTMIAPKWFRTEPVLAHARLFFEDYAVSDENGRKQVEVEELKGELATADAHMKDYYCYVLLDFVTADRELEEAPLAAALQLVEKLDFGDRFAKIAQKEMRLRARQIEKVRTDSEQILSDADKSR